ncbi:hypothetical protein HPB51_001897 [Rhipicephalus microplus]|uniref:Uncharacterized protein n=1 Tax=Rhipicephalus microplus TaxID=6941 RepID=A0A9J6DEQ9_RHIMP|nr:hypothetical protein HPB51_001897 [Rhipicephalus microplus]
MLYLQFFRDSPDNLSGTLKSREQVMKKKRREDEQLQNATEEPVLARKKELEENKLTCLDEINSCLHRQQEKKYWWVVNADGHVIFTQIKASLEEAPNLISSIVISSDMSVRVFVGGARLSQTNGLALQKQFTTCVCWCNFWTAYKSTVVEENLEKKKKVNGVLKLVVSLLEDIS